MSAAIPTYPSTSAAGASTSAAAASAPSAAAPLGIGSAPSSIDSAAGATYVEKCQYSCFAYFSQSDPSLTRALVLASSQSENPDYKALAELLLISLYSKRQAVGGSYFDFKSFLSTNFDFKSFLSTNTSFSVLHLIEDLSPNNQAKLAQYLLANHKQKLTPDMFAFLCCWTCHTRSFRTALMIDKELTIHMFAALGIDTVGKTVEDSDLAHSIQYLISAGKDLVDAALEGYCKSPVYSNNRHGEKPFCDSTWLQVLKENNLSDLLTKYNVNAAPASAAAAKPPASTPAKK